MCHHFIFVMINLFIPGLCSFWNVFCFDLFLILTVAISQYIFTLVAYYTWFNPELKPLKTMLQSYSMFVLLIKPHADTLSLCNQVNFTQVWFLPKAFNEIYPLLIKLDTDILITFDSSWHCFYVILRSLAPIWTYRMWAYSVIREDLYF